MKALHILKTVLKDTIMSREKEYISEAINELEQIQDRILQLEIEETDKIVQDIMLEKDEALAIERLMYKKLLEKNKELSDQIALNNPFKNRSCEDCKFKYVVDSMCTECRCNESPIDYIDFDCFPLFSCSEWEPKK